MSKWISVDERLPEENRLVVVFSPPQPEDWPGTVRIDLDFICPDYEGWHSHSEHYEHFMSAALPAGTTGPKEKAPYTHWMELPEPPSAASER